MGTSWAFMVAVAVIVMWAVSGPVFGYSDTWQLVINTGTTIVTFLMVFLIQNTQNRDAKAQHLKLDMLIKATKGAQDNLMDAEELSDDELDRLKELVDHRVKMRREREGSAGMTGRIKE